MGAVNTQTAALEPKTSISEDFLLHNIFLKMSVCQPDHISISN